MKPLLFLDVDGPLNPYAEKPWRRPEGYTTHRLRPRGWERTRKPLRVWLNPSHGPLLLEFAELYNMELVWATTWQDDANKYISPVLGLPDLPFVDFDSHPETVSGWKFPAIRDFAAGRPLVWLDDDFGLLSVVQAKFRFIVERSHIPTLLYIVDPRVGLLKQDLNKISVWLESPT